MNLVEYARTPAEIWQQVDTTEYGGDPLVIAAALYDAALCDGGGFTVKQMAKDWKIPELAVLVVVQAGWQLGRWGERRSFIERRGAPYSPDSALAHMNLSERFPRLVQHYDRSR